MGREDDALARRAAREARRAAMRAQNGHEEDAAAQGDGDAAADPIRAAREAATAAAVGAAVGAMRALTARRRDEDGDGDGDFEAPADEADDLPELEDEDEPDDDEQQTPPDPKPEPAKAQRTPPRRREGTKLSQVERAVRAAREQLRQLHGADAESISSFERVEDGWRVTLEVVELRRIPETTDVMASYAVELDRHGDLVAYERVRRYQRSEALDGSST